jgi:2-amino-4-hydroxy-6-hydroxymethyldihydropteridine diphosphokinase
MTHQVYVSIGSNIEPLCHVKQALHDLTACFGTLNCSPVYESAAVGFAGDNFYNLVVGFQTEKNIEQVQQLLSEIERNNGRKRHDQRFNARTLDLDLLLFDQAILKSQGINVPRDEILKYAFVLRPLADLIPQQCHPQTQQTYATLWQQMQQKQQPELWRVELDQPS